MCSILTMKHFCVNISILPTGPNGAKMLCDTETWSDLVSIMWCEQAGLN